MIYRGKRLAGVNLWKTRGKEDYLLVYGRPYYAGEHSGYVYDAIGELMISPGERVTLAHVTASSYWLRKNARQVSFRSVRSKRWLPHLISELNELLRLQNEERNAKK